MADWSSNGDWTTGGDWAGVSAGGNGTNPLGIGWRIARRGKPTNRVPRVKMIGENRNA